MHVNMVFHRIITTSALVASFAIMYCGYLLLFSAPGPPVFSVSPTNQRVEAELGRDKVFATYRVTNRGGRNLILGEATTTCGCSVASIERAILKPGESGDITVEATPPGAGERTVEIQILTNAAPEANLRLWLTAVGKHPIPYVANSSGNMQFGFVHERPEPGTVWIETREARQQKPCFTEVSTNIPELKVSGGFEQELPFAGDVVFRRYSYKVEISRLPKPGDIVGEIYLKGSDGDAGLVHRVAINGTVRPPVYAIPTSIYANYKPGVDAPKVTVRFITSDPKFPMVLTMPKDIPKIVSIRPLPGIEGQIVFEVVLTGKLTESIRTSLIFETNHPECKTLKLPLTLNLVDSGG